jgi:O-antigen/teichoic acid export membrane protein
MLSKLLKNSFFRNSLWYTIGTMITPLIGFIMLPIFTNYLTPAEYGIMTTVQTLVGMLQVFLLLSLHGAVTRFYFDFISNKEEQKKYLGSIFMFVIIFSTVIAIFLLIFSQQVGSLLFSSIPIYPYFYYLIFLSWISAILSLPLALLRAQERAIFFVIINLVKAILIMALSIYFIIYRDLGAESALLSHFVVTLVVVVFLIVSSRQDLMFTLNFKYIKNSLLFSLPLIPHVASAWIIASSDRIILEKFVTLKEIGIYALAVQVSMILSLFYQSINNALMPRYTKLRKENNNLKAESLLKIFFYLVIVFGGISIPIAMLGTNLLASEEYKSAIWLIPFLILGIIIKGLYYIPVTKLFYHKKTAAIAKSSTIAAFLNIAINMSLIPIIGIYGAIISTIIAEVIRILLINKASRAVEGKIVS